MKEKTAAKKVTHYSRRNNATTTTRYFCSVLNCG